jgi:hypothetical protein
MDKSEGYCGNCHAWTTQAGCTCTWHTFESGANAGIPQRQLNAACLVHGGRR